MIVDTSAIVAILQEEPDAAGLATLIEQASEVLVSTATVLEASLVLGPARRSVLDAFLAETHAVIVPFDQAQLELAHDAHVRFGRGSGSPARLSFGDCFAYALAVGSGQALLFEGDDFSRTDVLDARSV